MDVNKPADVESSSEQPEVAQANPDQSNRSFQINFERMDENFFIISDTEKVISHEEKDTATALIRIRDAIETHQSTNVVSCLAEDLLIGGDVKHIVSICTDNNVNKCIQCCLCRRSKYTTTKDDHSIYICDDNCIEAYKAYKAANGDQVVINSEGELSDKYFIFEPGTDHMIATINFVRKCAHCYKKIEGTEMNLSWRTNDFCNEFCLYKHWKKIGSTCENCYVHIGSNCLGRCCGRFGCNLRPFCSSTCLDEYKNRQVCSYCEKDMSEDGKGFLKPLNDKGQIMFFCSENCLERYDTMSSNRKSVPKPCLTCSVCLLEKPIFIELEYNSNFNYFCGEPCFLAFKFVHNITPGKCGMCRKYFANKILEANTIFYNGEQHSFCSRSCQNIHIIANRNIVSCSWCTMEKYNFDMIKRTCADSQILTMCSVNCLNLCEVSCLMSDALASQNKFCKSPSEMDGALLSVLASAAKSSRRLTKNVSSQAPLSTTTLPTIPIISNFQPLATTNGPASSSKHEFRSKTAIANMTLPPPALTDGKIQIKQQIIVKAIPLPVRRNTAFKIYNSRGINCKPTIVHNKAPSLTISEVVASDKKEDNTNSKSKEGDNEGGFNPEPVNASNTFRDDMVSIALKIATELDEPAVNLEGALASTIRSSESVDNSDIEQLMDESQPIHMIEGQSKRDRKRTVTETRQHTASKRGRHIPYKVEIPIMESPKPSQLPEPVEKPNTNMCLKCIIGVNVYKQWITVKNAELEKSSSNVKLFKPEILQLTADELNYSLSVFVKELKKPNGQEYTPDIIYYLCLGIQQYFFENGRIDNIFCDPCYKKFTDVLDKVARKFSGLYNDFDYIITCLEEEHLWESKQLGAHSPQVLLNTLVFFNTKHFNLATVDDHMQLSFCNIMNPDQSGGNKIPRCTNVLEANTTKKLYDQQENDENCLRCPVKLYEFYLSKCPESIKTRNDVFYLQPQCSCVLDSPVWYSTMSLATEALEKMLHRVKMVKEIIVASFLDQLDF